MNIIHISPTAPYNEGWGYQENLLPKYQAKLGHSVTLITTNLEHRDGKIVEGACVQTVSSDGFTVIRKKIQHGKILRSFTAQIDVYHSLCALKPDFVFFHGLNSVTISQVIAYKKKVNPNLIIVQDNHMDPNIGYQVKCLKDYVIRAVMRGLNRYSIRHVEKVYGVTPWRKQYAESYYGIPEGKTDILIMGADDDKIDFGHRKEIRDRVRNKYGIKDDEFLIVTGGKIDKKKKIDILMRACQKVRKNVKLLIFGSVSSEMKAVFDQLIAQCDKLIFIGWIPGDQVYEYFFAADLVFFPGQHSVLWEQACASKVPCVFEKWDGMDHVNNGGNSMFISPIDEQVIAEMLEKLVASADYAHMKAVAESERTDIYLYSRIAQASLKVVEK